MGWSHRNRLQLNPDKCKELRISFSKHSPDFTTVQVDNKSLEVVRQAKLPGLTFDNKLSWHSHIENIVKKASKRLYFLYHLKKAKIPTADLVLFYITCVRSAVDYAVPVFHCALPKYLIEELERIFRRGLWLFHSQE